MFTFLFCDVSLLLCTIVGEVTAKVKTGSVKGSGGFTRVDYYFWQKDITMYILLNCAKTKNLFGLIF